MAPTFLAALNASSSVEHTGRVLHEVIGSDAGRLKKEPAASELDPDRVEDRLQFPRVD